MKRFIKSLLLFSLLVTCTYIAIYFFFRLTLIRQANFRLDVNTQNIIIGHSHSAYAYNDSLIPNFKNLSSPGESYYYTYPKVIQLIKQNPQVKRVFIEYTNNQITNEIDKWIWKEKYLSYYFAIYSPFIEIEDHLLIVYKNPRGYLKNLPILFKDNLKKIFRPVNYAYEYGGYVRSDKQMKDLSSPNDTSKDFVEISNNVSTAQIKYLKKIVVFLENEGKEVVLVRSPQHKSYEGKKNEEVYKSILLSEFSNLKYIDFSDVDFQEDCFMDPEHLNSIGAEKISKMLYKLLKGNN